MTERILIVGPAWVGDMVMAQSLFTLLATLKPGVGLTVLAPAWTLPLLACMPEVSESMILPLKHGELALKTRYRVARELRSRAYQQAIVLPNSFKSALVPWWAHIPLRTGFRGEMRYGLLNDCRTLDRQRLPRMIDRLVALGLPPDAPLPESLPLPRLVTSEASVAGTLSRLRLERTSRPVLALCPGAEFGPSKQWPDTHFATVARETLAAGWQVWLLGSAADRAVAGRIQAAAGEGCVNLAGETSLGDAIDLLSVTQAVVTNDSGLMHVAAALGRRLVAVYGSTSPVFTPPLSPDATVLQLSLPCQPCFRRTCPLTHHRCMQALEPEHVLAALSGSPS